MFVLDASIALAWFFIDEATPETAALLEQLAATTAFVPEHFSLELTNVLLSAERKKRVTYPQILEFLSLIERLNIQIDRETADRGFHNILALAYSEKLTSYDAGYLELAMRLGVPLATKDIALRNAAKKVGIKLMEFKISP